ncbi:MAG: cytochrome ubiquinol oxidase subunit I [Anaerolineales bacterium]|jgi:cytochrome d ubiquinol oxidase subunit I
MDSLIIARWQFAITTIFHFFFVPLTLGLSIFVAILETRYVRTGDEMYKKMAKFWGKIFIINFVIGVVTGIVQEFQFGMNWSEYSRFMGDIFGAPLAIEALLAFYLESTFIGLWVFGWDRLSKKVHLTAAWLVAIASNLSALWILIANSFMHYPVGYSIDPESGRALMSDFGALALNPHIHVQFPHVFTAGISLAGFVVMAFSAWHLLRKHDVTFFRPSFRMAAIYALIGSVLVGVIGHFNGLFIIDHQPLKMSSAEAHWETAQPASFIVFALIDEENRTNTFEISIPYMLSFLSTNSFTAEVKGINDLEAQVETQFGAGDYLPPVTLNFWTFRLMVGIGLLMILIASLGVLWSKKPDLDKRKWYLKATIYSAILPYLAVTSGWILTETGRWPWIVYGLQKIEDGVSPNVPAWNIAVSLGVMLVLYTVLTVIAVRLAVKYGTSDVKIKDTSASD